MTDRIPVNIAVCGRFHYHKWAAYLDPRRIMPTIYYSHKIGEHPFGEFMACNKSAKEYLIRLHGRILGDRLLPDFLPLYHHIWERAVLVNWKPARVAHVMLHGAALDILKRCRAKGTFILGEAVNAHIDMAISILAEEHDRLGLPFKRYHRVWEHMRQEYELCDRILVPSEWVARSFTQAGFAAEKVITIPYPSGMARKDALQGQKRKTTAVTRVLCVAGIQVRKGLHYLVEAVGLLNRQSERFSLTLVGRCADKAYYDALRRMNIPFNHVPHVSNEDMVHFMDGFDIFVLPSIEDGFGVVVTEALEAGLPVVTTANCGAADVIVPGKNGFIVPAQHAKALADAIFDATQLAPTQNAPLSQEIYNWPEYALRIADLYEDCVRSKA